MATTSPQPSDSEPSAKKVKLGDDNDVQSDPKVSDAVADGQAPPAVDGAVDLKANNNGVKPDSSQQSAATNNNTSVNNNNNSNNKNNSINSNSNQTSSSTTAVNSNNKPNNAITGSGGDNVSAGPLDDAEDEESTQELDVDPKIKECLEDVEAIQNEIESLNEKASEEILKVEQKYNKLRKPFFDKRNELLKQIPNFWIVALTNNNNIAAIMDEDDEECLHYLTNLDVEEFEDIKSGYRIKFYFAPNPFFTNDVLVKEFHCSDGTDEPTSKSTPIDFKTDFEPARRLKATAENYLSEARRSRHHESGPRTFFSWFMKECDSSIDDVAEIIKEELWPNPLQFYLMSDGAVNDSDDDEDDEEDDDAVVIDEDDDGPEGADDMGEDDDDDEEDFDEEADDDVDDDDVDEEDAQ